MGRAARLVLAVLAVAALVPVSSGFAQQVSSLELHTGVEPTVRKTSMTAGLGVAAVPDYEGSSDYKGAPVVYFRGLWPSGRYVQFLGTTLMGNVLASHTWQFGPMLRYRAKRGDVKNDKVDDMEDVDATLEAGGFAGFQLGHWNARVEATQAVSHDNGFLLTVRGGYTLPVNPKTILDMNVSTTYANSVYMETYFGVDSKDAAKSGLDRYDANAGIKDVAGTVLATYRFTPKWGLMGAVRYARLVGDAADSPIVQDEGSANQFVVGAAVTYSF